MLRITHSTSGAAAVKYFEEGLQRADYFASKEQTIGEWHGRAATMLGLSGEVRKEDFSALCYNQKPGDGEKLNPRHSDKRKVGYDFTFSVPKSVSIAFALSKDEAQREAIRSAFEQSVEETMQDIEQGMRTQKGQGKDKHYALTGNAVWASFTHRTSRPVAGVPDPHLHRHCYVFNTTWNAEQERFQAGEFGILKQKAPYYEAAFQARVAMKVKALGYGIDRRGYSWELSGIASPTLAKFSRRTAQIEALAKQQGDLTAKQKEKLGGLSRAKKIAGQSWERLKTIWRSWLTSDESETLERAGRYHAIGEKTNKVTSMEAVSRAVEHLFERKSVAKEYQVKAEALKRSFGDCLPEHIDNAMGKQKFFREERYYSTLLTTEDALQQENQMLAYVRNSKGTHEPLNPTYTTSATFLNDEQQQAIHHALNDVNAVTIISGGAGVGKTTLVKEIRDGVQEAGIGFFGFAPSAAASRGVMQSEGFGKADTLARLLVDQKLQGQVRGGVIWVDEAGLIGNKDMLCLLKIIHKQQARLLLTGDVKQHSAVMAGDALKILEQEGGVKVVRVHAIQRQRNNPLFKNVVSLTSQGKIDTALYQLDQLGGLVELTDKTQREQALVQSYIQATMERKTALIIAPTHKEGEHITTALRQQLQSLKQLDNKERRFTQLKNMNWTEEHKKDLRHYAAPDQALTIEFHQHATGGHRKGDRWQIESAGQALTAKKESAEETSMLPLPHSDRFTVYRQQELALARGDKIRITKGGTTREGTRIHNGNTFTVSGFTREGHIKLHTGKTLDKTFGHLAYGYCTTSHSSQGKTVDRVFIAQSSQSFPASSSEQFYVSISRAREMATLYTDDKKALEKSVLQSGQRMTAREIAGWQMIQQQRKEVGQQKARTLTQQLSYGNRLSAS